MSSGDAARDGARQNRTQARRSTADEQADLERSLRELSELATGRIPLRTMLTKVAEYAVQAIPGAEGAGLTLIADDRSETLVSTNQLVTDVDAIQYGIRQGPCITAAMVGRTMRSHSLGEDQRWPEFGPRVVGLGVHSALSLPLIAPNRVVGAMNIYARSKDAFSEQSAILGELFAVPAAVAVQNGQILAQAQALAAQLQTALGQRVVIDQAVGLLIGRDKVSGDDAERWLRAMSRERQLSLHEVAAVTLQEATDRERPSSSHPKLDHP